LKNEQPQNSATEAIASSGIATAQHQHVGENIERRK